MQTHVGFRGRPATLPAVARVPLATVLVPTLVAAATWWTRALLVRPAVVFLWWNLVLAWTPWVLSTWCTVRNRSRPVLALVTIPWLLLLPNAPYLTTDLVHLRERHGVSMEFDVLLFASFALAGCALGWVSLRQMHLAWSATVGPRAAHALTALSLGLTGFGVYLGRFVRLNSWDVVTAPKALLEATLPVLTQADTLVYSCGFAAFFSAGYLLVLGNTRRD